MDFVWLQMIKMVKYCVQAFVLIVVLTKGPIHNNKMLLIITKNANNSHLLLCSSADATAERIVCMSLQ